MKKYILISALAMILLLTSCGKAGERGEDIEETSFTAQDDTKRSMESIYSTEITNPIESETEEKITIEAETENTFSDLITEEDFKVIYNNIEISGKIPFSEVAENLGISLPDDDRAEIRAYCRVDEIDYKWYKLNYPSEENPDFKVEYVVNMTTGDSYIVSLYLYTVPTFRGLKLGDSMEDLFRLYNIQGDPDFSYTFVLGQKGTYEGIDCDNSFWISKRVGISEIGEIFIKYNHERAFEELDIVAFD